MPELSPRIASELAEQIYSINKDARDQKLFLARPEFQGAKGPTQKQGLTAEVGFRLLNTKDAFGMCVQGGKGYENDIFIIFRGSTSLAADWMTNARLGVQTSDSGFPVHIGFNSAFKSMLPKIKDFLRDTNNSTTVHCIGHSLGGAVASITAAWLATNTTKTVKLYTFGAPKPGLFSFAKNLTRKVGKHNIYRTYHATDPVPMVPLFPFIQPPVPGFGHYIPSSEGILTAEAHDMRKYVHSVTGSSWKNLERIAPPYAIESSVKLWLESKTPVNAGSHKIWQWINSGLIYVITKIIGASAVAINSMAMGAMTLADNIAWMLQRGIELGKKSGLTDVSKWVLMLMNKIMQALGMGIPDDSVEMTQAFIRNIMIKLMRRTNEEAQKAVSNI